MFEEEHLSPFSVVSSEIQKKFRKRIYWWDHLCGRAYAVGFRDGSQTRVLLSKEAHEEYSNYFKTAYEESY